MGPIIPGGSWIDDIKEWKGMSLRHLMDIVHDREQWKMVVNSCQ
jgi:hypothetical protein